MAYKKYKLKQISDIISGKTAPKDNEFSNNGKPFIRAGNLEELCSGNEENKLQKINELTAKKKRYKVMPTNTIIFAKSGMSILKNRIYLTKNETYIVNHLAGIIVKKDYIYPTYMKYFFYVDKPSYLIQDSSYPSIRLEDIKNIEISLPPFEIQKKIADTLDKAQELIDKRKKQIEKMDEFLKSLFLDMFGDPVSNPMGWEVSELKNSINEIKYGTSKPPIFSEVGIPFIRATNIKKGRISDIDMFYISNEEADKISKCKLDYGDLVIVRSGANTGDCTYTTREYIGAYGAYDIIVKLNEKLNSIFLNELLNSMYRENVIDPLTRRAGQPHLNSKQIQNLRIIAPPIDIQNKFAEIVEKTELEKVKLQKSLTQLENNFNSIMQRAFKGELF
ncbi:MAG: restriction endonuclease subunit S [Caldisericia bacterium]|nr:restriction endonuclease subunit S [Caldisericia bacterium]